MGEVFDYENPNREAEERKRRHNDYVEDPNSLADAVSKYKEAKQAEEALKNSCMPDDGSDRAYIFEKNKKKKRDPQKKVAKTIAGIGITIGICFSLYGMHTLGVKISDKVKYHNDLGKATAIAEDQSIEDLLANGLAAYTKDDEFVIIQNSPLDYTKLDLSSPEDIWTIRNIINDDKEFADVIQACSYYDEEGNHCYYTDLEQFLRINGYFDTKTGEPSEKVWENYAKDILVTEYRNGELTVESNDINYTESGRSR